MFTAFMVALTLTAVANVLITLALGPLITALFSWLITGQRLPLRTWCAVGLAGMGIGWMFASQIDVAATGFWLGVTVAIAVPIAGAFQLGSTQSVARTRIGFSPLCPVRCSFFQPFYLALVCSISGHNS